MRLRNWLLTGSSLAVLALSPYPVFAQVDDELRESCIAEGFTDLGVCLEARGLNPDGTPAEATGEETEAAPADEPATDAAPAEDTEAEGSIVDGTITEGTPAEETTTEETTDEVVPAEEPVTGDEPVAGEDAATEEDSGPLDELLDEGATSGTEETAPAAGEETLTEELTTEGADQPADAAAEEPAGELEPVPDTDPVVIDAPATEATGGEQTSTEGGEQSSTQTQTQPETVTAPETTTQSTTGNDTTGTGTTTETDPATGAASGTESGTTQDQTTQGTTTTDEAPATSTEQQTAPTTTTAPAQDVSGALASEVDAYNAAIADLISGGDQDAARQELANARGRIAQICAEAGYGSIDECLAANNLELPEVPGLDEEPLPEPQSNRPAETPAAEGTTTLTNTGTEPTVNAAGQPTEVIEDLPEGVTQEAVAPVLDSAKDVDTQSAIQQQGGQAADPNATAPTTQPGQTQQTAPTQPAAPPPESDFAAQSRIQMAPEQIQSVNAEQGQTLEAPPELVVPQNVTIVNQITNNTTVNNTTVNNTTVNDNSTNVDNSVNVSVGFVYEVENQLFISNPGADRERLVDEEDTIFYEELSNGRVRETVERPDGTRIVTVRNRYGDIIRRSRIEPEGREYVLAYFDDSQFEEDDEDYFYRDPGDELPPLTLNISVNEYVLDAQEADEEEIELFFSQPPVEEITRLYSIEEVKRSARIRDTVRRLEIGGLTFDTGRATISRDQVGNLSDVASAMLDLLEANPAETFLIEGHTDAVGSDVSNLELSDRRANTVAQILSDFYDIPPENLATQGYGERYLKIRTESPERENRRVTIRRITPLVTPVASN